MSSQMVVHNPMGYPPKVSGKPLAPRLDTLNGRTVYLMDCRFDDSDILLKSVQAWFTEHMPAVKPMATGALPARACPAVPALTIGGERHATI